MNKRKIYIGLIFIALCIFIFSIITLANDNVKENEIDDYFTVKELDALIQECDENMEYAHIMAEMARKLKKTEDDPIIIEAQNIWWQNNTNKIIFISQYEDAKIKDKANFLIQYAEHPISTEIWLYLKGKDLNDFVAAGIIGNMMAEVGGQTLDLIVDENTFSNYYGLCQWSTQYHPNVYKKDLTEQLDYLMESMPKEFNYAGFCYKEGFNYNDFLELTDEKEAAYAFAKCYERCTPQSYWQRQQNATIALQYFTL